MALSYKARKRLAIVILLVGLPVYVVLATTLVGWIDRPSMWVELAIYVGLGVAWALPLKRVFLGIAQPDPAAGNGNGGPEGPPR
jgi:uncharacterized protein (DUF983 family)